MLFFLVVLSLFSGVPEAPPQPYTQLKEGEYAVHFRIRNAGIWVDGQLTGLQLSGSFDPDAPENSRLEATVKVKSMDTGIQMRDDHLMNEKYFAADAYPRIRLQSSHLERKGEDFLFRGELEIKGVRRRIEFPFSASETGGGLQLRGSFSLDRLDYGIGGKSLLLGRTVEVDLNCILLP